MTRSVSGTPSESALHLLPPGLDCPSGDEGDKAAVGFQEAVQVEN